MDDEQRAFLPNLGTGEAIVFCGGWHGPAHAAIRNDHAQTDNHEKPVLNLDACGARQLWRERVRYYPRFCHLGWLSREGDDPQQFARFVRSTRQAQKQLLRLINPNVKPAHAEAAFVRIKQWHTDWQPLAQGQLANAWMGLLLDANPRSHANIENVKSLIHSDFLVSVTGALMALLAQSTSLQEWNRHKVAVSARDLLEHLNHLSKFKSF